MDSNYYFEHIAEIGDTYRSVAKKFSIGEELLRAFNDGVTLSQGAALKVPVTGGGCARGAFYIIRRKDTLYRIARRFCISVNLLLEANPYLNPAMYIAGQVIVIPLSKKSICSYTLAEGERLIDVLKKYDMDLSMFCALNPKADPIRLCEQRVFVRKKCGLKYRRYTMKQGDTIASVAGKRGISAGCLLTANKDKSPSSFVPGAVIKVPFEEF